MEIEIQRSFSYTSIGSDFFTRIIHYSGLFIQSLEGLNPRVRKKHHSAVNKLCESSLSLKYPYGFTVFEPLASGHTMRGFEKHHFIANYAFQLLDSFGHTSNCIRRFHLTTSTPSVFKHYRSNVKTTS